MVENVCEDWNARKCIWRLKTSFRVYSFVICNFVYHVCFLLWTLLQLRSAKLSKIKLLLTHSMRTSKLYKLSVYDTWIWWIWWFRNFLWIWWFLRIWWTSPPGTSASSSVHHHYVKEWLTDRQTDGFVKLEQYSLNLQFRPISFSPSLWNIPLYEEVQASLAEWWHFNVNSYRADSPSGPNLTAHLLP